MAQVKGSKQYHMIVVPYRPWRRVLIGILLVISTVAAVLMSYYWGHFQGMSLQSGAVEERNRLRVSVVELTREAEDLRQQVANLKLGAMVDHKAGEEVRNQVIQLKAQIAALEEDITFYRSLMSPSSNDRGLTIGSLNVISTGVPRHYEYKLVVQQLATNHQVLNGSLEFKLVGRLDEELVTIPLYQVSDQVAGEAIRLRFKYFQNIEGQLVLPEGFEPERIELLAKSTGQDAVTIEKKFGWLVQEI